MKVAVLAGGRSSEHDVSLMSAEAVRAGLAAAGHEVIDVQISRAGKWTVGGQPLSLVPGGGLLGADVVFPALHGPYGEDGTVQGLLEHLDVAYVGAGVMASAVCMHKAVFKDLMGWANVPQPRYTVIRQALWDSEDDGERQRVEEKIAALGWPVFVKPARLGSSVGISKVKGPAELESALETAFAHDSVAVVEEMAHGLEVEVSLLGDHHPAVSVPGQISYDSEWYDYDTKYTPDKMKLTVPAEISDRAAAALKKHALKAWRRTGCSGMARIDFFVDGETVLLSEVNTIPGFTSTSVYAKLLEASGVAYGEVLERLLQLAATQFTEASKRQH